MKMGLVCYYSWYEFSRMPVIFVALDTMIVSMQFDRLTAGKSIFDGSRHIFTIQQTFCPATLLAKKNDEEGATGRQMKKIKAHVMAGVSKLNVI